VLGIQIFKILEIWELEYLPRLSWFSISNLKSKSLQHLKHFPCPVRAQKLSGSRAFWISDFWSKGAHPITLLGFMPLSSKVTLHCLLCKNRSATFRCFSFAVRMLNIVARRNLVVSLPCSVFPWAAYSTYLKVASDMCRGHPTCSSPLSFSDVLLDGFPVCPGRQPPGYSLRVL
jgi:hypothetical protein